MLALWALVVGVGLEVNAVQTKLLHSLYFCCSTQKNMNETTMYTNWAPMITKLLREKAGIMVGIITLVNYLLVECKGHNIYKHIALIYWYKNNYSFLCILS